MESNVKLIRNSEEGLHRRGSRVGIAICLHSFASMKKKQKSRLPHHDRISVPRSQKSPLRHWASTPSQDSDFRKLSSLPKASLSRSMNNPRNWTFLLNFPNKSLWHFAMTPRETAAEVSAGSWPAFCRFAAEQSM